MTLSASNLSLVRGGRSVVEAVSASLETGTITAIVGPNGAGKSSLLMGLAGLIEPSRGEVFLGGHALSGITMQDRAKSIGYLAQSAEIAWDVAVEALVALGRLPHRDRGHEAIEAAIEALALEPLRHRPASRLSGGERARALLARVLAGEPEWILTDEPLAALDLAHQLALVAHLRRCAEAGQGVVIVLHDLALAMNNADRVLVLREGRLIADGIPAEALDTDTIRRGWDVSADWIGNPGARALITSV
ncbi:ABC transporter ATP-binding protein [Erythrobacter sp. THAF29]|uniref:ABC transporter ATP-binding protein n=1 Tax=Erythrobacter sp. THAF29 TaxID=2587851 RepID=UPI001269358D|nr:ABC transporter ATP-binding protein [Erythrobacter sp. THAF29]QFT78230.1 Hemin import ATP-binding protein HmuV [Erythrobacter sp. THAF29]